MKRRAELTNIFFLFLLSHATLRSVVPLFGGRVPSTREARRWGWSMSCKTKTVCFRLPWEVKNRTDPDLYSRSYRKEVKRVLSRLQFICMCMMYDVIVE